MKKLFENDKKMVRLEKNAFSPRHVRSPSFRTRLVALRQKKYLLKKRSSVKSKKGVTNH